MRPGLSLCLTAFAFLLLAFSDTARGQENPLPSEWIRATGEYKKSLEKTLALYRREFRERAERVARMREFYERRLIARIELEEGQRSLSELEAKLTEIEAKIAEAGLEIELANTRIAPEPPSGNGSPTPEALFHFEGPTGWSLSAVEKTKAFFAGAFGRPLPVSAWGQTAVHDRLRLDHRNAVDVAVHPDSPEGRALMDYLRAQGMPFIAFRSAVAGSATGAHIHIGPPSVRLSTTAYRGR